MPIGIYKRSEKEIQRLRKLARKPRTQKQIEASRRNGRKVGLLPKTEKQIQVCRENLKTGHKLPRTQKQIENARKMGLNTTADMIVEHHNDLCHGRERPDDITQMTHNKHTSLHNKIRIKNGTHNLLTENRRE